MKTKNPFAIAGEVGYDIGQGIFIVLNREGRARTAGKLARQLRFSKKDVIDLMNGKKMILSCQNNRMFKEWL